MATEGNSPKFNGSKLVHDRGFLRKISLNFLLCSLIQINMTLSFKQYFMY